MSNKRITFKSDSTPGNISFCVKHSSPDSLYIKNTPPGFPMLELCKIAEAVIKEKFNLDIKCIVNALVRSDYSVDNPVLLINCDLYQAIKKFKTDNTSEYKAIILNFFTDMSSKLTKLKFSFPTGDGSCSTISLYKHYQECGCYVNVIYDIDLQSGALDTRILKVLNILERDCKLLVLIRRNNEIIYTNSKE